MIDAVPSIFDPTIGESVSILFNFEYSHYTNIFIKTEGQAKFEDDKIYIKKLHEMKGFSGRYVIHTVVWDGTDKGGKIVYPGTYIACVEVQEDEWYLYKHSKFVPVELSKCRFTLELKPIDITNKKYN